MLRIYKLMFVIGVAGACQISHFAQPMPRPNSEFWFTDGVVNAISIANNRIYLGGDFSYVGPPTGPAALFDVNSGDYLGHFPRVNGTIYAVEPDGSGGWFLGGDFTRIGDDAVTYIAHVRADFSLDHGFTPKITGSAVYALARSGDVLYIGGQFTKIGTISQGGVAGLNVANAALLPWNPQVSGRVNAIVVKENLVYIGGGFNGIGSTARNRVAAIDLTTAKATDWNPNADNQVFALRVEDDTVYVGGQFTTVGSKPRNRLAALDITTGQASTWNPNPNGIVRSLEISGDSLFVAGDFTTLGIQNRNRCAAVSRSTGTVLPLNLQIEGSPSVYAVRLIGDKLFVGGNFARAQGRAHPMIVAANPETGEIVPGAPLGATYNGSSDSGVIVAIANAGNQLVCAGSFQSLGGVPREHAAALDAQRGQVLPWMVTASSPVLAIACTPSTIYLGGAFTNVNGTNVTGLAAVDPVTGAIKPEWEFRATNKTSGAIIKSLLPTDTRLYVGGEFSNVREVPARLLAAVDLASGLPLTFDAKLLGGSAGVISMAVAQGNLYFAGDFTSVGGQARVRLAAVSEAKGQLDSWNPAPNREVNTVEVFGDRLYVGGAFTSISGVGLRGVAAYSIPSHALLPFDVTLPTTAQGVNGIAATETVVYIVGTFESIGGEFRKSAACLNPDTSMAYDWNPTPSAVPKVVALSDEIVCLGGAFRLVGTTVADVPYIAVYKRSSAILQSQLSEGKLVLTANTGDRIRALLESSSDLANWTRVATNNSPGQLWTQEQPATIGTRKFFRFTAE